MYSFRYFGITVVLPFIKTSRVSADSIDVEQHYFLKRKIQSECSRKRISFFYLTYTYNMFIFDIFICLLSVIKNTSRQLRLRYLSYQHYYQSLNYCLFHHAPFPFTYKGSSTAYVSNIKYDAQSNFNYAMQRH